MISLFVFLLVEAWFRWEQRSTQRLFFFLGEKKSFSFEELVCWQHPQQVFPFSPWAPWEDGQQLTAACGHCLTKLIAWGLPTWGPAAEIAEVWGHFQWFSGVVKLVIWLLPQCPGLNPAWEGNHSFTYRFLCHLPLFPCSMTRCNGRAAQGCFLLATCSHAVCFTLTCPYNSKKTGAIAQPLTDGLLFWEPVSDTRSRQFACSQSCSWAWNKTLKHFS